MTNDGRGKMTTSTRRFVAGDLQTSGYSGLVLSRLAKHVCRVAGVDRACIFVCDRDDPRSLIAAAAHGAPVELMGSRVGADEGLLGRVLSSGEPLLIPDCRALHETFGNEFGEGALTAACAPIEVAGTIRGVLAIAVVDPEKELGGDAVELICELSEMAAAALDHQSARDEAQAAVAAHVDALAAAMDLRDQRTADHSEDVVRLARQVGEMLSLDEPALVELEFAARLHDVGKIRVPDAILNKPGPLNDEERADHALPRRVGRGDADARPGARGRRDDRALPPRALGRRRLSRQDRRALHSAGEPDHLGLRLLRRDDLRPPVPRRHAERKPRSASCARAPGRSSTRRSSPHSATRSPRSPDSAPEALLRWRGRPPPSRSELP